MGGPKWGSDALRLLHNSPNVEPCRVCGQPIPAFMDRWGRPWSNVGTGHRMCGWFRPDDLDVRPWLGELQIAATGQATMRLESLSRLRGLGLVIIRGSEFAVTELGRLLVARVHLETAEAAKAARALLAGVDRAKEAS